MIQLQQHTSEHNGKLIYTFTINNSNGMSVVVTNYGCKIISVNVPDRQGVFADIVLGYNTIEEYITGNRYFGAVIGRCTNRIKGGLLTIENKTYRLTCNNGNNHLHGGNKGFDSVVWYVDSYSDNEVVFSYLSADGEEGYPGNMQVKVGYKLTDTNCIEINYSAVTDKTTAVNLTNHSFFNLNGVNNVNLPDVKNHSLMVSADRYTVNNQEMVPTGEILNVEETILDLRKERELTRVINSTGGLDNNFVLNSSSVNGEPVSSLYCKESGRRMNVYTTQPCVQIYTGNFLDGSDVGKGGVPYGKFSAICIETQGYPDGNRLDTFDDNTLHPNQQYEHKTIFEFIVE